MGEHARMTASAHLARTWWACGRTPAPTRQDDTIERTYRPVREPLAGSDSEGFWHQRGGSRLVRWME